MNVEAKWIGADSALPSCYFKKEFELSAPGKAEIVVCGLGFFELYVNGRRVSEDLLQPVWSDYERRSLDTLLYPSADEFTHRVYFVKNDLTGFLKSGKNEVLALVGNGWYRQTERNIEGVLHYGDRLKLCFELRAETAAGESVVRTDGSELQQRSFVGRNNVYFGETQDLSRPVPSPADWRPVELIPAPEAEYSLQNCPPDRVTRRLTPKLVKREGKRAIFDAGENVSGWAELEATVSGRVSVRYAEELGPDSELDFTSAGGAGQIASDAFENVGAGMPLAPRFTWHGFRYFEVTGEAKPLSVAVVHADVACRVEFESDDALLNWIFDAFKRTQTNNMHCGVPSDCPHRERLGYTGDGQLACETALLFFDCENFYRKWLRDVADCQDKKSGHVQHTAPFYGGGGGPGGWGSAMVVVPFELFRRSGDVRLVEEYLPHMEKWIESMRGFSEHGLIVREYEKGWCLGDWCTPSPVILPEPFVNTYYYIKCLGMLREMCGAVGRDASVFAALERESLAAIKKLFEQGGEWTRTQGAEAFAIDLGIAGEDVLKEMCERYDVLGAFDTGIFGTDVLLRVLSAHGRDDLMRKLLTSETENASFGHMRNSGATTFWENWNGIESHDHPMFGACAKWLFTWLLGIRISGDSVEISPADLSAPLNASGKICDGDRSVAVRRTAEGFFVEVSGFEATFRFRGGETKLRRGENFLPFEDIS